MAVKECTKCGEQKPFSDFGKYKRSKDGLQYMCRVCMGILHRAYKSTPEAKEKDKERLRLWRIANPEKFIEQQRRQELRRDKAARAAYRKSEDRRLAAAKATGRWRKKNMDAVTDYVRNREIAKLGAIPLWTSKKEINKYYRAASKAGLTVDHIVPLRSKLVCGLHCPDNFQVLARKENSSKGNRYWPDMP